MVFSLVAAVAFACAMWITNNHLAKLRGTVRSLYTMLVVFLGAVAKGGVGAVSKGLTLTVSGMGCGALTLLVDLHGAAFSALFILMPRLNIVRNAPAMNMEPIAALLLGWMVLDQQLRWFEMLGASIVLTGIVLLVRSPDV